MFTAYLPTTGLEIIESKRIDLCVIDVMMPEMNGLEMCRKIRVNHNMPIIMLSAKSQDDDKIIGLGTGERMIILQNRLIHWNLLHVWNRSYAGTQALIRETRLKRMEKM